MAGLPSQQSVLRAVTELKLVQKPEGFELRDKRSSKSNSVDDWLPTDALYDAQHEMTTIEDPKMKVVSTAVLWFVETEEGSLILRTRFASNSPHLLLRLIVAALGKVMGWCN